MPVPNGNGIKRGFVRKGAQAQYRGKPGCFVAHPPNLQNSTSLAAKQLGLLGPLSYQSTNVDCHDTEGIKTSQVAKQTGPPSSRGGPVCLAYDFFRFVSCPLYELTKAGSRAQ